MRRLAFLFLLLALPSWATTRYAGPAGSGTTCSAGSPCSLAYLWTVTVAGDTILLNDGRYQGSSYMLSPTSGLSGTASLPITVSAVNDGEAWFDGQSARRPCYLSSNNDYWVMSGFNCSDSSYDTFAMSNGSDHNIVRRVVAWDGGAVAPGNAHVWAINYSSYENLVEDCAGFGTGRKVFTHFSGAGATTLRRFFGAFMYNSRSDGPAQTVAPTYNSYNFTMENSVLTWRELPNSPCGSTGCYGLVAEDRLDATGEAARKAGMKLYGNIAYVKNGSTVTNTSMAAHWIFKIGGVDIKDEVAFWGSDAGYANNRPFSLSNCQLGHSDPTPCSTPSLTITDASAIGGAGNSISANWTQTNVKSGANVAAVYTSGTLWKHTGSLGATICKRYESGVLTNTPIFPADGLWPMDARIYDALGDAGYTQFHVTTDLTDIFGAIDSDCIAGGSPAASITLTYPDAGGNFTSGNTVSIAWQSQGITGNVDVKVSRDGGSTKTTLATVAYNSSPYLWTVVTPKSANVKFYVEQGATIGASTTAGAIKGRLTGIKP